MGPDIGVHLAEALRMPMDTFLFNFLYMYADTFPITIFTECYTTKNRRVNDEPAGEKIKDK